MNGIEVGERKCERQGEDRGYREKVERLETGKN